MKNMQDYLNTDFDGRYLFSGSRVRTQPVQIGASSLAAFQAIYDGAYGGLSAEPRRSGRPARDVVAPRRPVG